MPWLRGGDTSATHPFVMALVSVFKSDDRTMNEVTGFVFRCAVTSAAHMTDYRIDLGTAILMGNGRHELLLRQAVEAGLLIQHGTGKSKDRSWSIVEDSEFLHMEKKAAILWRRTRDKDRTDEALTVPVRHRDGDECRYCRRIVNWFDRKGIKGGTYDHLEPGKPATVATYVVCCGGCNRSLTNLDTEQRLQQLLPVPSRPFYSDHSAEWLTKRGITTDPTPAQSGSERAGAAGPESTSDHPATTTARPHGYGTAAHPARGASTDEPTAATARDESTDESTAATVRDRDREAPQPPARAMPWGMATAATTARPDFLSDTAATTARPGQPDPAATPDARPGGHEPDTAIPQRMEGPPHGQAHGSVGNQQITNRSDVWDPGRVGQGRGGSGAAGAPPGPAVSSQLDPPSTHQSSGSRRGRRGRRSQQKKG